MFLRRRSQLLQAAVHVSLAALPGPGAALQAKLPQVLLEVLVVHRPVGLRFTLCLQRKRRNGYIQPSLRGEVLTKCLTVKVEI